MSGPRAPLRVVVNPLFAAPSRFRAALYQAARDLAAQPSAPMTRKLSQAALMLLHQAPHDTTMAERKQLAAAEFRLAVALLRAGRLQDREEARRRLGSLGLPRNDGKGSA